MSRISGNASRLDLAGRLAADLAHIRDRARRGARVRTSDITRASASARTIANDLARDRASDITLALASITADTLAKTLDLARDRARDLARNCEITRDRVRAIDRARARTIARDLARGRARVLTSPLDSASDIANDLVRQVRDLQGSAVEGTSRVRVAAPASRLAGLAVRLLPASGQARYGEEWRSELHDLAAAGAGRRQQLAHAVRLFIRAVPLRLEVRAPRREKASP